MNDLKKDSNSSYFNLNAQESDATPLTFKRYLSLLEQYGITQEFYKHPVAFSALKQILNHNPKSNLVQMKLLLDDILTVSPVLNSFTIIFNKTNKAKLFSYKLNGNDLIYTKQFFSDNHCTIITKYFDKFGQCYYIDKSEHELSEPKSYKTKDYEKEEGFSL